MWAAAEGHLDVVDALLDKGANPNLKARASELTTRSTRTDYPSGGFTALHWAVRNGDEAVVRRLVEGGADLNITNADGATPMMLAIVNDRFDLAAKLVELGADANDGSLYYAMEMRDATTDWRARDGSRLRVDHPNQLTALDLAKVLLEAGADPDKPIAVQMHNASMCCDPKANATPFYRAAVAADVEALKLMLRVRAGFRVGAVVDQDGPAAARRHRRQDRADGRDERRQGRRHGRRPRRHPRGHRAAVPRGQQSQSGRCREAAARGRRRSRVPRRPTAIRRCISRRSPASSTIVRALVEGGADINLKDAAGKTALQVVSEQAPRPPPPTAGALVDCEQPAQPAEVAALLRELASGNAQAANAGGR